MARTEPILVIGSGGHAKVVVDAVQRGGRDSIVVGIEDEIASLAKRHGAADFVVAIGDNWRRHLAVERLRQFIPDARFPPIVHPSAVVSASAVLSAGAVVMAGAVVSAAAVVGEFCILNTACSLDHDSVVGRYGSLAPRAAVGGNCRIGEFAAIGIGATLSNARSVGAHAVIGAGAAVVRDIPERAVAVGVPARVRRMRSVDEPYM